MKIADGKSMTAVEIRRAMTEAVEILKANGVQVDEPGTVGSHAESHKIWCAVVRWLRARITPRSAKQVAAAFLTEMSSHVIRGTK